MSMTYEIQAKPYVWRGRDITEYLNSLVYDKRILGAYLGPYDAEEDLVFLTVFPNEQGGVEFVDNALRGTYGAQRAPGNRQARCMHLVGNGGTFLSFGTTNGQYETYRSEGKHIQGI